jgi:hypothetical protein
VDISDLYYSVLRKEHIGKGIISSLYFYDINDKLHIGHFTTSKSHRETIEHQALVYTQFYSPDEGFWVFIFP